MVIITSVHIQQALSDFTCCQFCKEGDISESENSTKNGSKLHKVFPVKIYKLSFGAYLHQPKGEINLNVNLGY